MTWKDGRRKRVTYLGESALFIYQGNDVHGFGSDHVQSLLIVHKLNVSPVDGFIVVLFLLISAQ